MKLDKKTISVIVGVLLSIAGAYFGFDKCNFCDGCPNAAVATKTP